MPHAHGLLEELSEEDILMNVATKPIVTQRRQPPTSPFLEPGHSPAVSAGGSSAGGSNSARQHEVSPTRTSPSGRPLASRTNSGRFEDPMLAWRSASQSESGGGGPHHGGSGGGGGAHGLGAPPHHSHHNSALMGASHTAIPLSPGGKPIMLGASLSSPTGNSKLLNLRHIETLLDSAPHSPGATVPSPVPSQSPRKLDRERERILSLTGVNGAGGSGNISSAASSVSPSNSLYDKLRLIGGARSAFGAPTSEGGSVSQTPNSRSLTFAAADDLAAMDRRHSYSFSPTRGGRATAPTTTTPNSASPTATTPNPTSGGAVGPPAFYGLTGRPPLSARSSGGGAALAALAPADDAAASLALAPPLQAGGFGAGFIGSDRGSGGDGRNLARLKSVGGRSMVGIRPLNQAWRQSVGTAAAVEGGLQGQTHEALQQLLSGVLDPSPAKRISAPGQALEKGGAGGHRVMHTLSSSHHHLQLNTHNESSSELEAGAVAVAGSGTGAGSTPLDSHSQPSGGPRSGGVTFADDLGNGGGGFSQGGRALQGGVRRFTKSLTEKLDARLGSMRAVELSYDEGGKDEDDDGGF